MQIHADEIMKNIRYLRLLAEKYPSIQSVATEIINLQAILNLPKGTEHFMSDLHGESDAFMHILNNASGVIREKIDLIYGHTLSRSDRAELAALIYYPERKLELIKQSVPDLAEFYRINLQRLIEVCRFVATKYTRSRVRKRLPEGFAYIIDELLNTNYDNTNKELYYEQIISTIIDIDQADAFVCALAGVIKTLAVDTLHIIGDIFDRGPRPDIICELLQRHHSVDIQWGNHDIVWMGAAAGSPACIATVMLNTLAYNNLDLIEDIYGINIRPLAVFAGRTYGECPRFFPHLERGEDPAGEDLALAARMRKAIAVILFKLEGQIILRHPDYGMDSRLLLSAIDPVAGTVTIDGQVYPLCDRDLPTLDMHDPYALSAEEQRVIDHLRRSFLRCEKLQRDIRFLYSKGGLYKCCNQNLLFHGCIPLREDGSLAEITLDGETYSGRAYLDHAERLARQGYFAPSGSPEKQRGEDFLWYLWCGPCSPLFGRAKMTTFERLFLDDEATYEEPRTAYYRFTDNEEVCLALLREFGLGSAHSHIINGHVPVRSKDGESPIKAGGRLLLIDGGFCKVYHKRTGIAGYTLIYNSQGMRIAAHEPFDSTERAVRENLDIHSTTTVFEAAQDRIKISDTDVGREITGRLAELNLLLQAYLSGVIKESHVSGK